MTSRYFRSRIRGLNEESEIDHQARESGRIYADPELRRYGPPTWVFMVAAIIGLILGGLSAYWIDK